MEKETQLVYFELSYNLNLVLAKLLPLRESDTLIIKTKERCRASLPMTKLRITLIFTIANIANRASSISNGNFIHSFSKYPA